MRLITLQIFIITLFGNCKGQQEFGTEALKLSKVIEMPSVNGRIDHMAVNLKDRILYLAALGNNTVEVIDLEKGILVKSIKGISEPQGIAFIPEQNEFTVASGGSGDCIFYNASTFAIVGTVHLNGDADNIRYDARDRKMYVGYGNGGLALIDPVTHKLLSNVELPAHPESFQLDKKHNKLYVNLPDKHAVSVIDLQSFKLIDTWNIKEFGANFPMALDTANNLVLIGFRHPAVLIGYDGSTGKQVNKTVLVSDVDDIFYSTDRNQVFASGGQGYINIFSKGKNNSFTLVANIASSKGARTSYLIPSLGYYILAKRAQGGHSAAVAVYKMQGL